MRVDYRVAMPGKMFGGREPAILFYPAHISFYERAHPPWIFAKRPHVDDGVIGVAVDVRHGSENPVHAHGPRLVRCNASHRVRILRTTCRGHSHHVRKGCALLEPHRRAALEIRRE